jgi:phenol 2-monooxygenase
VKLRHKKIETSLTPAEKSYKHKQAMYGRASTLYPRTLEMLDQLDVLEPMAQIGYIARNYVNFRGGKRATSGGYKMLLSQMHDTYIDYVINIRQKYSEQIFREAYEAKGGRMDEGTELVDLIQDQVSLDDYALTAVIKDGASGQERQVKW